MEKIRIYDTTLRDGAQAEGISFSTEDKLEIASKLDIFGIDYIEGGWPASNPKDTSFFELAAKASFRHAKLSAFGSTRRAGLDCASDSSITSIAESGAPCASIFGKAWDLHVTEALRVSLNENLEIVADSIAFLKKRGLEVLFCAEHFFDGYANSPDYALAVLEAAEKAGADWLVLCDTNGGSLPSMVEKVTGLVVNKFSSPVGIHTHNDAELAVANSLAAVSAGALMVQGTINGIGERCGNANLCSIIPNLELKMGLETSIADISQLTQLSRFVSETANMSLERKLPYVGTSAFAHKGGIHVSAVLKNSKTYEHVDPVMVGNERRILISELSGNASLRAKLSELDIDLDNDCGKAILQKLKDLESQGYQFEGAEASFELLVRRIQDGLRPPFRVEGFRIFVDVTDANVSSEASIKVFDVSGMMEHTAANGNGPVNALDRAVRKALERFYPQLKDVRLVDYKVRVIDGKDATEAKVRVLMRSTDGEELWTTIGVSPNIIEASLTALLDSLEYKLLKTNNLS